MNQAEKWDEIADTLKNKGIPFQFRTVLEHNGRAINVDMDMDPGGGFEGGFEFTVLSAPVPVQFTSISARVNDPDFRFAIHDEKTLDRIGKFFGMEDVHLGYDDFDSKVIVKTNNKEIARQLFSDPEVRRVLGGLKDFSFQISSGKEEPGLELMIDRLIDDPEELRALYTAYTAVLDKLK